ncbi:MAG: Uma2 family endonuclease [Vulcanimicrobiaceae bacterium]
MELARRQFTIEEYLAMAETGILREGERVELIDGAVVAMSPFNDSHRLTLNRLTRLLTTQFPEPYVVQIQMTMALGTFDGPEPDAIVFRDHGDAYRRVADPATVALVIEVADSSLRYDRVIKAPLYARYGVAEYWIVNLVDDCVETFRDPRAGRYATARTFASDDPIASTVVDPPLNPNAIIRR